MDLHFLSVLKVSILNNKNTFNNSIYLHGKRDEKKQRKTIQVIRESSYSAQQCLFALLILYLHFSVFESPAQIYQTRLLFMCQQSWNLASGLFCFISITPATGAKHNPLLGLIQLFLFDHFSYQPKCLTLGLFFFSINKKSSIQIYGRQQFKVVSTFRCVRNARLL